MLNLEYYERELQKRGEVRLLPNGVTMILEHIPNTNLINGKITICAGYNSEPSQIRGIRHLLEHMTFNGSKNYPATLEERLLSACLGLNVNALTDLFSINYSISGDNSDGMLLSSNFMPAFNRIFDMVVNPNLDDLFLTKEKNVVLREIDESISKKNSNPNYPLIQKIFQILHSENKYLADPGVILGNSESVRKLGIDEIKSYHSNNFVSNNVIFSLLGDLNDNVSISEIEFLLGQIPVGKKSDFFKYSKEIPLESPIQISYDAPIKSGTARINMYYRIPKDNLNESLQVKLANYILGGNFNSLLMTSLRENHNLVYSINSNCYEAHGSGFLNINYEVSPSDVDRSIKLVDESIEKLKQGDFNSKLIDAYMARGLPLVLGYFNKPGWIGGELMQKKYRSELNIDFTNLESVSEFMKLNKQLAIDSSQKYLGQNRLVTIVI